MADLRCSACERTYPAGQTFCPHDGTRLAPAGSAAEDPLIGLVLDRRYRVDARVGRGGCGTVYRARQLNVDRDVAIKVLTAEAAADSEMVRRFETEARIISRLHHPNTLKLHDFGHTPDGRMYLVTEFLRGFALDERLRSGPLGVDRTVRIMQAICRSLAEAHEQGVIHRDLKPGNVFLVQVGAQEVVKVLDFGIAKLTEGTTVTAAGKLFGTPAYMSPEQARGDPVDPRSDLYSLGILAYECLAGAPPFEGSTPMSLLLKHIQEAPRPLRDIEPPVHVAPELDDLISGLLAKAPDGRPADALAVLRALDAVRGEMAPPGAGVAADADFVEAPTGSMDGEMLSALRAEVSGATADAPEVPRAPTTDVTSPPDSSRRGLWLAGALGVVATGLMAWLLVRGDGPEAPVTPVTPVTPVQVEVQAEVKPAAAPVAVDAEAPADAALAPDAAPDAAPIAKPTPKPTKRRPVRRPKPKKPTGGSKLTLDPGVSPQ